MSTRSKCLYPPSDYRQEQAAGAGLHPRHPGVRGAAPRRDQAPRHPGHHQRWRRRFFQIVHLTFSLCSGGGINPAACTAMLHNLAKKSGVEFSIGDTADCQFQVQQTCKRCLSSVQVSGDDMMAQKAALQQAGVTEMFSGRWLSVSLRNRSHSDSRNNILLPGKHFPGPAINSMNAYYGAGNIFSAHCKYFYRLLLRPSHGQRHGPGAAHARV